VNALKKINTEMFSKAEIATLSISKKQEKPRAQTKEEKKIKRVKMTQSMMLECIKWSLYDQLTSC
jgi:hypothetical protein